VPPGKKRSRQVVHVLCGVLALLAAARVVRAIAMAPPTDFDDAYMFLRYARNLLDGHGLVWNAGEGAVHGVTSLLHLVLVTSLRAFFPGLDDGRLLQVASTVPGLASLGVMVHSCARAARHPHLRGATGLWAFMVVPAVSVTETFVFHCGTGMDTMTAVLANAVLVSVALHFAERPSIGAAVMAALAGYLAVLARPDNVFYALMVPSLTAFLLCPHPRRRLLLASAGLFCLFLGVDLALRWHLLGTALPLAFHAKRPGYYAGFAGEYGWNPFLFLKVFLTAIAPFLLVLLSLSGRASGRPVAVLLVPVLPTFTALFFFNQIMGHLGRFFFPALPFFVVAAALALDRWLAASIPAAAARGEGLASPARFAARLGGAAAALAVGGYALGAAGRAHQARGRAVPLAALEGYAVRAETPLPEVDSWRASEEIAAFANAAPPETRFAMSEHGLVGARAPRATIIDVLGLHDRTFALEGFSAAALWARRPDVVWMPHPDHTQMIRDMLDSDELWRDYAFYPDAFMYGLALRLDGPHASTLATLLEEHWARLYPSVPIAEHRAHRTPMGGRSGTLSP
jgi:hypothetical protein